MATLGFGGSPVYAFVKWKPLGDVQAAHCWQQDSSGVPVEILGVRGHVFVEGKRFRALADGLKEFRTLSQTWLELEFASENDRPAGVLYICSVDGSSLAGLASTIHDLQARMPPYRIKSKQKPPWAASHQIEEPQLRSEGSGRPAIQPKAKALAKVKAACTNKTGRVKAGKRKPKQTAERGRCRVPQSFHTLVKGLLASQGKPDVKIEGKALRLLMTCAAEHLCQVFEKAAKVRDKRKRKRKTGKARKATQEGELLVDDVKTACEMLAVCRQ